MKAVITVEHEPRLLDVFSAEDKNVGRAQYTVEDTGSAIEFHIEAEDATAMRTATQGILKLLKLWEDSKL